MARAAPAALGAAAALLLLLLLLAGSHGAKAEDGLVRVGVLDWDLDVGDDVFSIPASDDSLLDITRGFALGAIDFNRRASFLPEVAALSCSKNLTLVRICDYLGLPRNAVQGFYEFFEDGVDAVAGLADSNSATSVGILADVLGNIPTVSYWATNPSLSDRSAFNGFCRLCTTDADIAGQTAALLSDVFHVSQAVLIYYQVDSGPPFAKALGSDLQDLNITLFSFTFDYPSVNYGNGKTSLDSVMSFVSRLDLNIIVIFCLTSEIPNFAQAAYNSGLLHKTSRLFIFTALDVPVTSSVASLPHVSDFLQGSLFLTDALLHGGNAQWFSFLDQFPTSSAYNVSLINSWLPPHGSQDSISSCRNSAENLSISSDWVSSNARSIIKSDGLVFARAYDSMIAIGLASCLADAENPVSGSDLYSALLNISFHGLSGLVNFNSNGDRNVSTIGYVLYNFFSANGTVVTALVGEWDPDDQQFLLNSSIVYAGSSQPVDVSIPIEQMNYLPQAAVYFGYAQVITVNIILFACLALIGYDWNRFHVIQPVLTSIILLGCVVASISILSMSNDDNPQRHAVTANPCMTMLILFNFGFQMALLALIAKLLRVFQVFNSSRLRRGRYVDLRFVVGVLGSILVAEVGIFIAWFEVAPMEWIRTVDQSDTHGNPISSHGACQGTPWAVSGIFLGLILGLHALALWGAAYVASKMTNIPGFFEDATLVSRAVINLAQAYAIVLPVVGAVYFASEVARFLVMSMLVSLSIIQIVVLAVLPRIYEHYVGRPLFSHSTSSASRHLTAPPVNAVADNGGGRNEKNNPTTGGIKSGYVGDGKETVTVYNEVTR